MAYVFTELQKTDIRRFLGYRPAGTDMNHIVFGMVFNAAGELEYRLDRLTEAEGERVVEWLDQLADLETAILSAADNLDADSVAVLHMNKSEIADRTRLFDMWRYRLCDFLGLPPGPGLRGGRSRSLKV